MGRSYRINVELSDWRVASYRRAVHDEARAHACTHPGVDVQVWLHDDELGGGGWEKRMSVKNLSGRRLATTCYAEDRFPHLSHAIHARSRSRRHEVAELESDAEGFEQLPLIVRPRSR